MRIAVLSDVHGNLPALRAVLTEVETREPFDAMVGGGDYALGGSRPARCVEVFRKPFFACVRGNTDEWIVQAATDGRIPASGYSEEQAHNEAQQVVDRWTASQLQSGDAEFLAALPIQWQTTGPSGKTLAVVHATPWSTHPVALPDAPEATLTEMLDAAGTDALVYCHIHRPYVRQVGGRTIACAGSIGIPFDDDWRPCFLIATDDGNGWQIEHVRVPYDRDAYLSELARSGIPNAAGAVALIRNHGR